MKCPKMKFTCEINLGQAIGLLITLAALVIAYKSFKYTVVKTASSTSSEINSVGKAQVESAEKLNKEIQKAAVRVTIEKPRSNAHVGHAVPMEGTVNKLPPGMQLWIVKEVAGRFHPDRGPASVKGSNWTATAFVGNARGDSGEFTIHVVLANQETGVKYNEYLDHAAPDWNGLDTLNDGVIVGTVTVIRDK